MTRLSREDAELLADAIHNKFGRYSGMNPFSGMGGDDGFVRDGRTSGSAAEKVEEEFKKYRKVMEDTRTAHKRVWQSIRESIPIYGRLQKAVKSSVETVERQTRGQSESYRQSADAMAKFVHRVGANSSEIDKVTKSMAKVQDTTKALQEIAKKRKELEDDITNSLKETSMKRRTLNKSNYQNVGQLLSDAMSRLEKTASGSSEEAHLVNIINKLKELKTIPDSISELRSFLKDKKLKEFAAKNPELKPVIDEMFTKVDSLLNEGSTTKGNRRAKKTKDIIDNLDELSSVGEKLGGLLFGYQITAKEVSEKYDESSRKLREAMGDLVKSIGASVGEAIVKESKMFMTRQRLTGATQAYSLRDEAIGMGISETALLTSVTENKDLIRRMAQDTGDFAGPGGGGRFVESGGLNEIRKYSREMGLMGQEAIDNILKVSDDLRVTGFRLNRGNIRGSVDFFRDTFKDLGLTQQKMRDFYAEMSTGGLLRVVAADENARLASLEAMQNEVEFRGKLARVLNQELEIQQKRVRELAKLAYGDPAAALKQSIGVEIMARQAGMSRKDAQLLGEQTRTGGASLNEEERFNAAKLHAVLVGDIGKMLTSAAKGDQLGQRMVLTKFMELAGIDALQAVEAYVRRQTENGEDIDELTIKNIMESDRANTERGASELGQVAHTIATTIETAQGVLSSAIGNSTVAIVGAIREAAMNTISMLATGAMMKGGMGGITGGIGKFAKGGIGKFAKGGIGKFASRAVPIGGGVIGAGMTAASISRAGTPGGSMMGSAMGGASTGAMLGSPFGIPGMLIGGAIGGLGSAGLHYAVGSSREAEKEKNIRILEADIATGRFGANTSPEFLKERSETRKKQDEMIQDAIRFGKPQVAEDIAFERKHSKASIEARSIMGNISAAKDIKEDKDAMEWIRFLSFFAVNYDQTDAEVKKLDKLKQGPTEEATADLEQFFSEDKHLDFGVGEAGAITELMNVLRDDVNVENEEKIMETLQAKLDTLIAIEEGNLQVNKDEQQNRMRRFRDMSADEIRKGIEQTIHGSQAAAASRVMGNMENLARDG